MRILLVDDHALFRAGTERLIREMLPDAEVLHAGTCAQGIAIAQAEALNLVFLDIGLPDGNGLDALAAMKAARPSLPVVMVSGETDSATMERAIALHAMGFVPKSEPGDVLLAAIGCALAGGVFLPPGFAGAGRSAAPIPDPIAGGDGGHRLPPVTDHHTLGLTPRQFEVLRLLVQGPPNKTIARTLDISLQGVKKHVSDLLAHFQVMNRSQLIVLIARRGILLGAPGRSDPAGDLTDITG